MEIKISKINDTLLRVTFPDGTYILIYGNYGEGCEVQSGSEPKDCVNSQERFEERTFKL